jgi:hypothetical protein
MSDHHVTLSESGYPRECSCAEYQRRVKAYRNALPCTHMLAVARAWDAAQPPPPDPWRVRVDAEPHYPDTYDVTIDEARFIGSVTGNGAVRILAVELAGKRADYPLEALTDDAIGDAGKALAAKARALAACGEVDTMALPNVRTWREDARQELVHAKSRGDRRAQRELDDLQREEAARAEAVATRCEGEVAA